MVALPFQVPTIGRHSPWGYVDHFQQIADGVWWVSTPRHGGYILSPERAAAMPDTYIGSFGDQRRKGYYEEDVDWCLVEVAFPDDFAAYHIRNEQKPGEERRKAEQHLLNWHPDFAIAFGLKATPENSRTIQYRIERNAVSDRFVVVGVLHGAKYAPQGFVRAQAALGGDRRNEIKEYLIPETTIKPKGYSDPTTPFIVEPNTFEEVAAL